MMVPGILVLYSVVSMVSTEVEQAVVSGTGVLWMKLAHRVTQTDTRDR